MYKTTTLVIFSIASLTATSCFAQSIKIACHFVPYSHCYLELTTQNTSDADISSITEMTIKLQQENFNLFPGLYEGTLTLKNSTELESSKSISLRIRNSAIAFDPRFTNPDSVIAFLRQGKEENLHTAVLLSQRIPLIIPDPEAKSGTIKASIELDGQAVAHSQAYMEPFSGCWFDEAECAERDILQK